MTRHRTQPIPETITIVAKHLPKTLVLYKCDASPYWYTRYFSSKSGENKIHRKSTKTENLTNAKDFARKFYEDILLAERNFPLSDSKNRLYKVVWKKYIEEQILRQSRKEVNPKYVRVKKIESRAILKAMGHIQIKKIDFKVIDNFLTDLSKKGRTPETLKKYKQNIQGVLKYALRENLIDRIPPFPTIKRKDQPRGWFSEDEYEKLRKVTRQCIKDKITIRGNAITDEMRYFITFMVNTFLRPSDVKRLKHRNIQIVEKVNEKYLRIQTDDAKTSNRPVVSMEVAVGIYRDILNFHKKNKNPYDKDDYVFLPKHKNKIMHKEQCKDYSNIFCNNQN